MNLPSSVDRPLSAQRSPLLVWAAGSILLALAYAGIGRLALLLAVPPGYATAVFPSAGVALAALLIWGYRYGFGVLLGSYALNVWVALAQGAAPLHTWGVPLGVALGAALQALAGAALIRRWVGYPAPLLNGRDVLRFLLLGAFVSALISPSVGVTVLWLAGV
ncbi:MAG TPA: histidine kinase, partial [Betaproteobacteria bacterium]|nr:histidine kinase [Betaproteobacteria bacterium]